MPEDGLGDQRHTSIIHVTEKDLDDAQKQLLDQAMENYKAACLQSFSTAGRGKVILKTNFPTPRHVTITEDPMKFQEMFDQAMYHALINQSSVMTNSIQNTIYQMMNG